MRVEERGKSGRGHWGLEYICSWHRSSGGAVSTMGPGIPGGPGGPGTETKPSTMRATLSVPAWRVSCCLCARARAVSRGSRGGGGGRGGSAQGSVVRANLGVCGPSARTCASAVGAGRWRGAGGRWEGRCGGGASWVRRCARHEPACRRSCWSRTPASVAGRCHHRPSMHS
jgi:hypothetical protein